MLIRRFDVLTPVSIAVCILGSSGVAAQPQAARTHFPDPTEFLPAPKIEPGDVPRACATSGKRRNDADVGQAVNLLNAWGHRHFKFSENPNNPKYCFDWDFVISKWQQTVGHPATGLATKADGDSIKEALQKRGPEFQKAMDEFHAQHFAPQRAAREAERERVAQEVVQAERKQHEQQLAEKQRTLRELAEMKERERQKTERDRQETIANQEFSKYLSKTMDPQAIYLQAGKYERMSDSDRAKRLYEFLADAFPKSQWAVKSNDRLLQLRSDEVNGVRRQASQSPGPGARNASQDDAMRRQAQGAMAMDLEIQRRRNDDDTRQRWERERMEREERERAQADFIRQRNEQTRRQQEQWQEEERRRRQQP